MMGLSMADLGRANRPPIQSRSANAKRGPDEESRASNRPPISRPAGRPAMALGGGHEPCSYTPIS